MRLPYENIFQPNNNDETRSHGMYARIIDIHKVKFDYRKHQNFIDGSNIYTLHANVTSKRHKRNYK